MNCNRKFSFESMGITLGAGLVLGIAFSILDISIEDIFEDDAEVDA
mgnify:CR=1 FL=1